VIRALLKQGQFAVRAVTRKANSEKADELRKQGAEVVEADLLDIESTKKVLHGAYGAFIVTSFWELGEKGEAEQGRIAVDVCKAADLKHVVFR
jgi:uncharacterized protein YbjT (DUF2867 family)